MAEVKWAVVSASISPLGAIPAHQVPENALTAGKLAEDLMKLPPEALVYVYDERGQGEDLELTEATEVEAHAGGVVIY